MQLGSIAVEKGERGKGQSTRKKREARREGTIAGDDDGWDREREPERRRGAPRALSGDQNAMVTCPRLETRLPARCRCPERSGLVAESVRRRFASWQWAPHFVFGLSAFILSPHHHRHPGVPPLSSPASLLPR